MLMCYKLHDGGNERQVAQLALALDRARFRVHVAAFRAEGMRERELRESGVPVHEIPIRSFRNSTLVKGAAELLRLFRELDIDIVHPFDYPTVALAVPLGKLARLSVVLSSQTCARALYSKGWRFWLRITDVMSDRVTINSEFVQEDMLRLGVPARKLVLLHNGLDASKFHPHHRGRLPGLKGAGVIIGAVSVLRPEKGIDVLIRAAALLKPSAGDFRVLIVGSGEMEVPLKELARSLRVEDCCLFYPAASDVASFYRSMDLFVLPSHSESFSNSLMEAMACGCCPVASDVGGNSELVKDGITGRLFPGGDAAALARQLECLIADEPLRKQLASEACRRIHAGFAMDVIAKRFGDFYESLLRPQRGLSGEP